MLLKQFMLILFYWLEYGGGCLLKLSLFCIPNGNLNAVVDIHSELNKLAGNIRYYQWRQWAWMISQ